MDEIAKNNYNLNIPRYLSTSVDEEKIVLEDAHKKLVDIEGDIAKGRDTHNGFLVELEFAAI